MTKNQKIKLGLAVATICYGLQIITRRSGEPWLDTFLLGTASIVVTYLVLATINWLGKP